MKAQLEKLYKEWCKETKRNGGILIGSSIKEFFQYVEDFYDEEWADPDYKRPEATCKGLYPEIGLLIPKAYENFLRKYSKPILNKD